MHRPGSAEMGQVFRAGLRGDGVGIALSLTQSAVEAGLRAGEDCGCKK
jgi:hypothetical protein